MSNSIQYGKVGVSLDAFTSKDKKAFISLLIGGGVRGDFNRMWSDYKDAQKARPKPKAKAKS